MWTWPGFVGCHEDEPLAPGSLAPGSLAPDSWRSGQRWTATGTASNCLVSRCNNCDNFTFKSYKNAQARAGPQSPSFTSLPVPRSPDQIIRLPPLEIYYGSLQHRPPRRFWCAIGYTPARLEDCSQLVTSRHLLGLCPHHLGHQRKLRCPNHSLPCLY